jgi:hypothetical protein
MDSIRPVTSLPPVSAVGFAAPVTDSAARGSDERKLDPAVSVDFSPDAAKASKAENENRGYVRDKDSDSVVFRITDTVSGDVIVQIPNEVIVKARVYGREQNPPTGELIQKHA